ncbi:hypothetical protein D3C86_1311750 [compost metagenome]
MAVFFPMGLVSFHFADLFRRKGGKETAIDEIAVDGVFRDAAADDRAAFKRHFSELHRLFVPVTAGNGLEITAIAVDDLAAIATRSAEADPHTFKNDDGIAALTEFKRCGNAGETAADDADIRFQRAFKCRPHGFDIGGGRVPGGCVAGIGNVRYLSHLTPS